MKIEKFVGYDCEEFDIAHNARNLSKEDVSAVRRKLRDDPDDLQSRLVLFGRSHWTRRSAMQPHWMWLIENHPRGSIQGWVDAPMTESNCYPSQ